jgi:archaellum component FlaF (FlaF/FlaG flagellin family)
MTGRRRRGAIERSAEAGGAGTGWGIGREAAKRPAGPASDAVGSRRRSAVRGLRGLLVTLAVMLLPLGVGVPAAFAGLGLGVTPTFPPSVTIGQTGIPASLQIANDSTAAEATGNVTINTIKIVPACGTGTSVAGTGDCPAANADPGVLPLSATGVGEAGTACAGDTFTLTVNDAATGQVTLTPSTTIVLTPPGTPNSICRIDFTLDVLKAPPNPSSIPGPNSYQTITLANVTATSNVTGIPSNDQNGTTPVVINKAAPSGSTTATPAAVVGGVISDTEHLVAASPPGPVPTGSITFTLFNNATCTGANVFTSTVPVSGAGDYPSGPFSPTAPGTYSWVAAYSGDANNAAFTSACGDNGEVSAVAKATPSVVTTASGTVPAGGAISDTGVLSGGAGPTGTITFTAFGPNDATCTGAPLGSSTVAVAGDGSYPSGPFTSKGAGTYTFVVSYSGDANNNAATSACGTPGEAVTVTKAAPAVVTTASGTVPAGGPISDSGVLSGGFTPTGTITFTAFGPNDATCTGTPLGTSTVTATGDGTYPSGPFTTTGPGTYTFVVTYSGDANNLTATSSCGTPGEAVTVTKANPTVATTASTTVPSGGAITDSGVLAGGLNPTGTITFTAFGPNDATCTATPLGTSTVTATGDGTYSSGPFTTKGAGTYSFVVTYSGDANNAAATSACGAPGESVVVTPAKPSFSTTATPSGTVGGTISDTAHLLPATPPGGVAPTGSITFTLFNNATCTGASAFTSTVGVAGTGDYSSGPFTPTAVGVYNWVASYTGDANNAGTTSGCGDAGEVSTVAKAAPTIVTTASGTVTAGGVISDSGVLAGGSTPTGTITFTAFGPNDATCTGAPLGTSTVTVTGNGTYSSGPFTTTGAGTYSFVASYSGDANNASVVSACGAAGESVTVTKNSPTIVTHATGPVAGVISDTATLAGGVNATGTITFTAFGPSNPTCTGAPAFTSTVTVAGNGAYPSGPFTPSAPGTYLFVASYGGDAGNSPAATACGDANESVTIPQPVIAVTKVANPLTMVEPGGTFTFTVQVTNPSAVDPITITTLTDNVYGNIATRAGSTCGSLIGVTLAPGATSAPCSFTGPFAGKAGDSQTDTVTVNGVDSNGFPASATAHATVTLTAAPPEIAVTKVASPLTEVEPGGTFTFTVQVSNPSTLEPVTITALNDNIYGNIATLPGSTCGALIGVTLAPGATSAPCTFTGTFTGKAGDSQTDVVTVTGMNNGVTVTATAHATVSLTPAPPQIGVTKVAIPASEVVPGGTFTFTVQVSNPSTLEPVTITTLNDNIYGNIATLPGSTCGALIGVVLAPGAKSAPCSFPGTFSQSTPGSQTDTVTVTGMNNGTTVMATAMATVTLTPVAPQIAVTKAASPLTMVAPGGTFTFTVQVSNPSTTVPVTITALTDNIYGNIATRAGSTCGALIGVTLTPGATSAACTFTGPFSGAAGASQTDIVTATGMNNGTTVTATAHATVSLTPAAPQIGVTKVASPISKAAPGGAFTFTVQVTNPSTVTPVTITALTDNVYGNLVTLPGSTCGSLIGVTLAPGGTSSPCTFSGSFTGAAGASQTDTVTVTGTSNGTTVMATAMATVNLTGIAVTKVASPLTKVAPGGTFTFTVQVSNPSTLEPVTITALNDNIYGNLATRPGSTCGALIGVVLAPGATSAPCTFTGPFTGKAGASETDTVTVTGSSNGTTVTATAHATVSLTATVIKPASVVSASTLHRPAGCVEASSVKVYVTGSNIKSVSYSLDGRHLGTATKKDSSGRYVVTVKTGNLSARQHKLVALVTYRTGKTKTFHATLVRCALPKLPLFTG